MLILISDLFEIKRKKIYLIIISIIPYETVGKKIKSNAKDPEKRDPELFPKHHNRTSVLQVREKKYYSNTD